MTISIKSIHLQLLYFESWCIGKKSENTTKKQPAPNGRFGASGGVSRPTLECRTATSALVQTAVESPACRQAAGTLEASRQAESNETRKF